jgi:hypothetical protein
MSFGEPEWMDFRLRENDIYFESYIYATTPFAWDKLRSIQKIVFSTYFGFCNIRPYGIHKKNKRK